MMRPRRVYVGADVERLFADYLTHLAGRAAELGFGVTADSPLLVNLERPPLLAALREGTVRDKTAALRKKGIARRGGPRTGSGTPTRQRYCLLAPRSGWSPGAWATHTCRPPWTYYGWVREDEALRAAANWKSYAAGWQVRDET